MFVKLIAIIGLLWAGMILGISFLESWVKFRAPSLTKPVGLDVGRTVFRYFHNTQIILLALIVCVSWFAQPGWLDWSMLGGLIIVLALQVLWLFPQLNNRVNIVIAGEKLPPSSVHALYGVAELIKLTLLLVLSIKCI